MRANIYTERINVRFSKPEMALVKKAAKKRKVKISKFIRESALVMGIEHK